ncbi:hypothetical protein D3872_14775 [Massilia cavernae]|uniref:Uncharacterized protein n=1 Tax=Massilia cavernae TaxID=2320864 RepID=A0A418XRJ5_9BURK|nr:hypothetical protein D3872_14775 [Massilia cavernae]
MTLPAGHAPSAAHFHVARLTPKRPEQLAHPYYEQQGDIDEFAFVSKPYRLPEILKRLRWALIPSFVTATTSESVY